VTKEHISLWAEGKNKSQRRREAKKNGKVKKEEKKR